MKIKTKTLWNGFASVSTILIERCKRKKEDLEIQYGDSIMVLPLKRLDEPDWIHKKSFKDSIVFVILSTLPMNSEVFDVVFYDVFRM